MSNIWCCTVYWLHIVSCMQLLTPTHFTPSLCNKIQQHEESQGASSLSVSYWTCYCLTSSNDYRQSVVMILRSRGHSQHRHWPLFPSGIATVYIKLMCQCPILLTESHAYIGLRSHKRADKSRKLCTVTSKLGKVLLWKSNNNSTVYSFSHKPPPCNWVFNFDFWYCLRKTIEDRRLKWWSALSRVSTIQQQRSNTLKEIGSDNTVDQKHSALRCWR